MSCNSVILPMQHLQLDTAEMELGQCPVNLSSCPSQEGFSESSLSFYVAPEQHQLIKANAMYQLQP